jgi:hypothetical protein
VRDRHVPTDLVLTEGDLLIALDEIGTVLPVVCEALRVPHARSILIENLVRGDFETYLQPALGESEVPKSATMREIGRAAHIGHSALYNMLDSLIFALESCALAIPLLLEARGEFVNHTVWYVTELDSPVGKEASGPGIVAGRQQLYGLARAGGDMCLPACLRAPAENIDKKQLTKAITDMLKRANDVTAALRVYARSQENGLATLDVDTGKLIEGTSGDTLLAPELHVGMSANGDWRTSIAPNAAALWEAVRPLGIARVVVESSVDHLAEPDGWTRVPPERLEQMLPFASQMGLDTAVRASEVAYLLRRDGLALHRHQHVDVPPSRALTGISQSMSFEIAGFDDLLSNRRWAEAIGYIEYLVTSEHPRGCAARFGERHVPGAIKAPNARPLLCAIRMISNDLLVSAARRRQVNELFV